MYELLEIDAIAHPDEPCPCGSTVIGRNCCLDERGRILKVPRSVEAPRLSGEPGNVRCYAASLGGCSVNMSSEHYVSHAILRRLEAIGIQLELSKFPWLKDSESRVVPSSSIKTKVLCTNHNHALSPFDAIGDRLCALLLKAGEHAHGNYLASGLFNGEDVERWLLKTLCGVVAMEVRSKGKEWYAPLLWLESLFKVHDATPSGAGLWVKLGSFEFFPDSAPSLSVTPIDDLNGEQPLGLRFIYSGLELVLLMSLQGRSKWAANGRFRPSLLSFHSPSRYDVRIGLRYTYSPPGMHLQVVEAPLVQTPDV